MGCHATDINSLLIFLSSFKFNMPSQRSDKNYSIRIIFIKIITEVNITKININNIYFITVKYNITRIFLKIEYIFICMQISKKLLIHLTCNEPVGNMFQCCYRIRNSFVTHFLSYIFIKTKYYKKGSSETTLSFLEFYINQK